MSNLLMEREGGDNLPPECWQLIFNHLNGRDLKAVSLACNCFLTNSNLVKETLKVVHPKVDMLSRHLKRFTQLKKIDLSYFEGDLDEALFEIARSDISLESLDVFRPYASITEGLRELESNPKMRNLKALTWIPLIGLPPIANWFPNLEELDIWSGRQLPADLLDFTADDRIECLASKLKHLKKISISVLHSGIFDGCHSGIFDGCLVALSKNCVDLTDVSIDGVKESCIGLLIRNRPNLEALSIKRIENDSSSTITIANSISHARALTSLDFMNMEISDELLMAIAKAKLRLENFRIRNCTKNFTVTGLLMVLSDYLTKLSIEGSNFVDEDIKLLSSGDVGNLTHIVIGDCQVTNSTLFLLLSKCPSLEKISISRALYVPVPVDNADNNNVSLSKYHKIRNIHLPYWTISDELAKQFGLIFPNIKVLNLSFTEGVTSICIEAILKSCKHITQLILERYRFTKIIEVNSKLPEVNLKVLSLQSSGIDDEGLAVVGTKCPQLVDLDLSLCKNVTAKGIKQIFQNIKTLTCLHMWYCDWIDYDDLLEWILSTNNFASLKELSTGRVDFTEEQRGQFLHHGCLLSNDVCWRNVLKFRSQSGTFHEAFSMRKRVTRWNTFNFL